MNGGKLVQNCDNHALWGTHNIIGEDGTFAITSTHHQMQFPYLMSDSEYEVLYKSEYNRSNFYDGSGINPDYIYEYGEPEIVRYTVKGKPVSLAIQGHPEYMDKNAPVVEMLNNLINETLNSLK